MKILQIIPSISLVYGGPSQMVLGLSAALARQGEEVTILTTNSNGDVGQAPLDVPLDSPVEQDGYQIRYFPCSPFRRYKFSVDLLRWLSINGSEYDIAHLHALFSPVISGAATVARLRKIPYILRPLGTLDPADLRKKKAMKQVYTALWERGNLAGAAAIHFTSAEEAKISERFGVKTRDLIIPLGVSLPGMDGKLTAEERQERGKKMREELGIADNRPLVLFLSRIEPKKGLDLLLPALEKLLAQGLAFHFVLAGSNPQDPEYEGKIRAQIADSPLADCTTLPGFVRGEFKVSLLQAADIFVLPSYYENFGIAVAEAMAAGTAVCVSRGVYIWEDVLEAGAGWVGNGTVEEIAQLLSEAVANPQECQKRGEKGQEYAAIHYNWDAIAQQTLGAYREILAPG
ncbi:hormogonium polysaccharide biosynthesis glycosyltransferase HpsP [Laspinema sp. D1]|uniref:hormogonium polysaccharide biosynthesis glycosyltransferase HpsP n=1 Tax=Laspinema palackyanum TaxID=3231601 RepID=UPI0034986E03|nr:hormogonium polysaccharide biosynthesis glycosyltransferase HpsP [Laspinema sp. D2b]